MKVPMVGENLGRYEIVRAIGSGAMGEVFAAYDENLEREIALKVLRPQFSQDFERRQRFEREAKAIAALDHPNIVTIYSVEEDDGTHFITMQLVEGRTLDELIPEGGMPTSTFLELSLRLVEAVAAAHHKGIVHRDLKPSNVMVGDDGRLKVLDFGLAKLRHDGTELAALVDPATMGLTLEGQIIGTVAYMSPEQAEGRAADHRSDIFSLGVLMYEMATGEVPFAGDTPISVMSSIIKDTPSLITQRKPGLPAHLGRIVRTCLAKDPVRRYQSAIDLRNALDDLKEELQSGEFEGMVVAESTSDAGYLPPPKSSPLRWIVGTAAIGAAAALVGFWVGGFSGDGAVPGSLSGMGNGQPAPIRLTSQAGLVGSPSWAPDGLEIVYSSDVSGSMDLWHQEADGRARQFTDLPGNETDPDWAPNGLQVAYTADFGGQGIQLIDPHGSQPTQLTEFGARPKWSPDSERILFDWRGDIYVVDARVGAEPKVLVADTAGKPQPIWSHDGTRIYYWNRSEADVYMTVADGGKGDPLQLVPAGQEVTGLAAADTGSFFVMSLGPYGGNKDIWKVRLGDDGRPLGDPVRLTWPTSDDIDPALSPGGSQMAYVARHVVRHLWAYGFDPQTAELTGIDRQLTAAADSNYYPSISADGEALVWTAHRTSDQGQLYSMRLDDLVEKKVTTIWDRTVREIGGAFSPAGGLVLSSTATGSYELWQLPCAVDCVATQTTQAEHPQRDVMPTFSRDGNEIAFYSNRSGNWDIWTKDLGNGAEPRRLTLSSSFEMYPTYSPSGDQIAFWTNRDGGAGDIWVVDSKNGASPSPLVRHPAQEGWSAWSPDGRWFFFTSDRSGSFNVWAQPVDGGAPFQVTRFEALDRGMPEAVIYTKFAVAPGQLIIAVEDRSGGMWRLDGIGG